MNDSKLKGCIYKDCPLCGVSTDIGAYVERLKADNNHTYKVLLERNEMIHNLNQKIAQLNAELARGEG